MRELETVLRKRTGEELDNEELATLGRLVAELGEPGEQNGGFPVEELFNLMLAELGLDSAPSSPASSD